MANIKNKKLRQFISYTMLTIGAIVAALVYKLLHKDDETAEASDAE